jgi:peptide/nickel transport system permease protein
MDKKTSISGSWSRPPGKRLRRLLRASFARRNLALLIGSFLLIGVILSAAFAGVLAPFGPDDQNITRRLKPPVWAGGSWENVLGTDELGRDILSRLMFGARISLLVGVVAVVLSGPLGVLVGLIAGYFGGKTDDVLMRLTEIQLAIPTIMLAIAVVTVLGPGLRNVIITLSVTGWTLYARLIRGETLAAKGQDYVDAARAIGAERLRIMFSHLLPNVISPAIVTSTFAVANMIILEATLSFLGLGVEPRVVTWGSMLKNGRLYLTTAWWLTAFPGLAIFITVLGVNLVGDFLRDHLDPHLRNRLQ